MVEKISTENRFSEDKDKPFAGACAATEWKIPSTKTISARLLRMCNPYQGIHWFE
jgi:hypothetical protein